MSVAIITGASSGIGREFARQLKEKCGVDEFWFVARRRENMEALRDELGVSAEIISADLTKPEGIDAVRERLTEKKPTVKYLVNAAGFGNFGAFDELPESDVAGMIDLNVKATVLLTHLVVPYMVRGGRIVQLGSGSCFTPLPYFNVYSSSKVFVLHYTKSLNYELKKYGIRATCLCPGWVETEFLEKSMLNKKTHPKSMKPLLKCEAVVAKCLKALKRGRAMCVMNWYTKLQHVLFKLMPDPILTKMWLGMLVHPTDEGKAAK
ncbi:MAG: SDR family NAD(P)-dependent oxidoreductase [Clostridia bacterium]|nr:SDR family NAD(P)-dependent oxidoreductase [Clostridia bacterium]